MGCHLSLIGKVIVVERTHKGISQSILASTLQVNQSTVSRIEKGDTNISLRHYQNALAYFGMDLHRDKTDICKKLQILYALLDSENHQDIETIYQAVKDYSHLNVYDHYTKMLLLACFGIYKGDTLLFNQNITYLMDIETLFNKKEYHIYQVMKGYYYHFKREFDKADRIFSNAYLNQTKTKKDYVLAYIYAYNNIILKKYRLSQKLVMDLITYYQKMNKVDKVVINKRLLGLIYYFDGNYKDTIKVLSTCAENETVLKQMPILKVQYNSFIASSYLALKEYKKAIPYLIENLETKINYQIKAFYYAYLFYSLKKTNQMILFNEFKEKYMKDKSVEKEEDKLLVEIFNQEDSLFDFDLFVKYFNTLYQHFFIYHDYYQHTLRIYELLKEELWKKRKYLIYKQLNEIILNFRMGVCDIGVHHQI